MDCIEQTWKRAKALRKRSRQLLALAIVTAALGHAHAYGQTFAEWFKQKKTQKQYLLQQISALMAYRQYAKQGYNVAKGGLSSIGRNVGNEYDLHADHYDRLKKAGMTVKEEPQVKTILARQQDILTLTQRMQKQDGLRPTEVSYVRKVCSALLNDCEGQLNDLQVVMDNNKLTMSDDERLRQIGRVHQSMQDNYRFASYFSDQLKVFVLQRRQGSKDVNTLKQLYGKVD